MASVIMVEMGETGLTRASDARLQVCGLGACVGLCLYETHLRLAVLVHIVLPHTLPPILGRSRTALPTLPGKSADTAVAHALSEIERQGGRREHIQAAIVGGAQIFTGGDAATEAPSRLEIGQRNVYAVKEELIRLGIPLCAEDTGGHFGRTVTLDANTGAVSVRPVGLAERSLIVLGRSARRTSPVLEGALAYGN